MTQQASTAGFRGSDTDGLDKIVAKMTEAAEFADTMVIALKALCVALDAMSWTGYAAALSAYIKGSVIPLLQAVSKNLKLFANVVKLASSVQKDTSSNKLIIDAGDTGYVPAPVLKGDPAAVDKAADPAASTIGGAEVGKVDAAALDTGKLQTVVGDIANIVTKLNAFAESVDGDGVADGTLSEQITKLGALVGAIEKLIGDTDGDSADGTDPAAGSDPAAGTDLSAGTDPASGTDPTAGTDPVAGTDPAADTGTASDTPQTFTAGQIWQAVVGALRDLGVLNADGTVADGTGVDGTVVDGAAVDGTVDGSTGSGGLDSSAVAGDIDSLQTDLNNLREHLGIEPAGSDTADLPSYTADPLPALAADDTMTPPLAANDDLQFAAEPGAGSTAMPDSAAAQPNSFPAEPSAGSGSGDSGSGGGSGGGETGGETGGGSGTDTGGGGSGSYSPEPDPATNQAAQPAHSEVVYSAGGGMVATGTPGSTGDVQTRLVATAAQQTPTGSAAVPLSGAAVAASLLGGLYARRNRSTDDDSATDGEEVYAAAPGVPS